MFRGIVDFFSRLRMPSAQQLFGMFYKSRDVTSALAPFNSTITELKNVAKHHVAQALDKSITVATLQAEASAHQAEADSAKIIAGKLQALLG
jgi:hypothetical protein